MENVITIQQDNWKAEIVPGCGGNLISLTYAGHPILRRPNNLQELLQNPCLYGLPLLMPANRVKGGRFSFCDRQYQLVINEPARDNHIHGLLNNADFNVIECSQNAVTSVFVNRGEQYPFLFSVKITDTLSQDGLVRKLILKNTGNGPMPYTLAFHAAFADQSFVSVPVAMRYQVDDNFIPTGLLQPLTQQEQVYRDGVDPRNSVLTGFYTSCGDTVAFGDFRMQVSDQFDHWTLFNAGGGRGFFCVEPQCGAVDGLNNGHCNILQPGAEETFTLRIYKKTGETG